jgi:peptide/nickel transport system permease protein
MQTAYASEDIVGYRDIRPERPGDPTGEPLNPDR